MKINVGNLIEILNQYDPELPVVIDAYEHGVTERIFLRKIHLDVSSIADKEDSETEECEMFGEFEEDPNGPIHAFIISRDSI